MPRGNRPAGSHESLCKSGAPSATASSVVVLSGGEFDCGRDRLDSSSPVSDRRASEQEKWFRPPSSAVVQPIESDSIHRQAALLRILVGCGEQAIEAFQAADNPVDAGFVRELERIIERSRDELGVLLEHGRDPASTK